MQKTILIVDDQSENLKIINSIFDESKLPYILLNSPNGKIGLKIIEKKLPDLIITDWEMPVMDGIEFIKSLKNNPITVNIPVIMCTGVMTSPENLKTALDTGAIDFVRKPVDAVELIARTKANLHLAEKYNEIKKLNSKIKKQKTKIEHSHKKVTDSINYASRIQQALLPTENDFNIFVPEHFILFKPRDVVSGDFYFLKKINEYLVIAAADCTGHGVPGAFVSMLGIAFLNEIVQKKEIKTAAQILEELRKKVKLSLKQTGEIDDSRDGMDIALCLVNTETNKLQFAGAFNSLYIIRNKELTEIKGTNNPIGIYIREKVFENNEIQLQNNDKLYMFSDGYVDQFKSGSYKKFNKSRFKELLIKISHLPLNRQKEILDITIEDWKKEDQQIDDILVIGIKIPINDY